MFFIRSIAKSLLRDFRSTRRQAATQHPQAVHLGLEVFESRIVPANYAWRGIQGGAVAWNTPNAWEALDGPNTGQIVPDIPGANDTARFLNSSLPSCTVTQATTVASLVIDGYPSANHLVLSADLTVGGGSLKTATPTINDYTIYGSGSFVIASGATFTWSAGYGGTATATVTITVSASPPGGGGTISGMVWNDQDGNGVREYEPGAYEVTVQLLDANGAVVATVQTWNGGMYSFGNLAPGQYRIRVIPPAGYTFSPQDVGSDDTDSDVDSGGYSGLVTITGGDTFNIDAGIHA